MLLLFCIILELILKDYLHDHNEGQRGYINSLKPFPLGQVGMQSNSNASIMCSRNRNAIYFAYMYIYILETKTKVLCKQNMSRITYNLIIHRCFETECTHNT